VTEYIKLNPGALTQLRTVNSRLIKLAKELTPGSCACILV
jgi:hypothetical protein